MQAPPFVARVDSRVSRNATALHNGTDANTTGDVVINMGDLTTTNLTNNKDTLFGPSIGVVSTAPEWCTADAALDEKTYNSEKEINEKDDEKREDVDELTPEVVKEWPSEPTTTLQALVNLKRPSIRLSPLAAPSEPSTSNADESGDATSKHHQQHGLEFEFDCDAPQCLISLHVVGVPAHLGESEDNLHSAAKDKERLVLFETTLPGGFARKLALSEGATLELARLEAAARGYRAQLAAATAPARGSDGKPEGSITNTTPAADNGHEREQRKKRLTFFRKKGSSHTQHSTSNTQPAPAPAVPSGPALAVVDAEAPHNEPQGSLSPQNQNALTTFFAGGDAEKAKRKKEADEDGVRIAIRLAARDADGHALKVRNEQVTYLHIVRQGTTPATATGDNAAASSGEAAATPANGEQENNTQAARDEEGKEKEDTRSWIVRVVKREARIGAHAFQLHEIYGLTAHASASEATHSVTPSSPPPASESHTYPPQPQILNGAGSEADDSPAECLLCLSSPREVVLLPCRHLVACRECAVNMVEFGAGGTVTQPEAEVPAAPAPATTGDAAGEGANGTQGDQPSTPAPAPMPTPTPAIRRKRKAKGWFCPVCRQPYTSLLRITTAPPPTKGAGTGHATTGDTSADAKRVSLASSLTSSPSPLNEQPPHPLANTPALPPVAVTTPNSGAATPAPNATEEGGMELRGAFASIARPGFLRGLSGRAASTASRERDLERGA
ncbi:uncharacterized protein FOMMEDRAFT_160972 [Fomitiporia mediterranea MF3/22]|uniref:uncharacterized protein n=1 Tax=Fomitiporia mediterranea (strain MF3/22) TaxID=694068 RepID=UPI00044087C5|nr:uncharacterized protein FOMMEDRAFT_160972 [Fomitiporia mediterranea MF3/22]EJC99358.1 hypothetical protein FOMMEDRAFT_160972 [Fomitiporia mediterranea MF3/22]